MWNKLGIVFSPPKNLNWMVSHAWVPTPLKIKDSLYRVYISGRNSENKTSTGFFDCELFNADLKVLKYTENPILKRGDLGLFDDSLVVGCSAINVQSEIFLYYVGWMQTVNTRYLPSIGLAISKDGGKSFKKYSKAPLISRSSDEPYGMASPYVMFKDDKFVMWYASYREWNKRGNESWPRYEIRMALSDNGVNWNIIPRCILGSKEEEAVARPWVIHSEGKYKMWFSKRNNFGNYELGYAESVDSFNWVRKQNLLNIESTPHTFDSEMMEYPAVIEKDNFQYLFYNGNDFGKDGVALAYRSMK